MQKLILLPGALGSSKQFESLKVSLSGHFHILTPDYPGHTKQAFLPQPISISNLTEWLLSFLEQEKEPVCLFGYSMGGYLALNAAFLAPSKVKAVMTLATKFDWNPAQAEKEANVMEPILLKEKAASFYQQLQQIHGEVEVDKLLNQTKNLLLELGKKPNLNLDHLGKLTCKTKIGVGDRDKMVGILESYNAYCAIPNAQFYVLPNTKNPFESVNMAQLTIQFLDFFKA